MKKRYLKSILALCLCALMLAGCSGGTKSTPSDSGNSGGSGGIRIGVTSMTLKEAVYLFVADAMKERAAEYGDVTVDWVA